jgi:hypothetical protein
MSPPDIMCLAGDQCPTGRPFPAYLLVFSTRLCWEETLGDDGRLASALGVLGVLMQTHAFKLGGGPPEGGRGGSWSGQE